MNNIKHRIELYDIAKALAIYAVVLCHLVYNKTSSKIFTMAFNMPLFYLLSGCFLKIGDTTSILEVIRKRVNTILIPYLLWGLIYSHFSFKNCCFLLYGSHETLHFADSLSSLWYLPVMFVAMLLIELITRLIGGGNMKLLILTLIFALIGILLPHLPKYGYPFGLDVAFMAAAFMLVGSLAKPYISRFNNINLRARIFSSIFLTVLFLFTFRYSTTSQGCILMCEAVYGNPLIFMANALIGSMMIISMSSVIESLPNKRLLLYIGQNTLGIFLVHKPFDFLARDILSHFGINFNSTVVAVPTAVIVLLISTGVVYVISKYTPYLLAKQK